MSESLRGHFLIAGKRLRDTNFFKTVVLIVEHGAEGAMGVVVNRPSCVTVAHALAEHFNLPPTDDVVYVGGPVEPSALFILHTAADVDAAEQPILPGIYVGSSAQAFEAVVRAAAEGDPTASFRIYSGCAGWAPGQLEGEIARGDWYILPATPELVFHEDPYQVWDDALARYLELHPTVPALPQRSEWN
jgi:putative transcriptional regulator